MADAYKNAVEDALHEEGHNAYNGTISTTDGFVDKTEEFEKDPEGWVEKAEENTNKWDCVWGRKAKTVVTDCTRHDFPVNEYVFVGWAAC
tara:strand:+ start:234 stop:503 length:270 start_codon:yes stop_codon:yes gene_type:complete